MTSIRHGDYVGYEVSLDLPATRKFAKRWRLAFATIHCSRAFTTYAKKTKKFPRKSPSYSSILIPDQIQSACSDHPGSFKIDQSQLIKLVKEKDHSHLQQFGGVEKVASALETDVSAGISGDPGDVSRRKNAFGFNTYKKPPAKGFFHFVVEAFRNLTIMILLVCAGLSLGFRIKEHGVEEGWYDGGSTLVVVFFMIAVSAGSNYGRNWHFEKSSRVSGDSLFDVIRKGHPQQVSIFEIVVGDVVCLKMGNPVPADGLFLDGHPLLVDESSMTGKSDHVEVNSNCNPFLFSRTYVADGYARMLVTSVGMHTMWAEMMCSISHDNSELTPLQAWLDKLTLSIGKVGFVVALLNFNAGQIIGNSIIKSAVGFITVAVTIGVVTIPEGLLLAETITLAYSTKRMMADQVMVRKLSACEKIGTVTTICTDKTGTLTTNQMKVTKFWVGQDSVAENTFSSVSKLVLDLIQDGVALNTMGCVYKLPLGSEFSSSPTEKAILSWAVSQLSLDMEEINKRCEVIQVEAFNSQKKRSGVLIRKSLDNTFHVHWKGAAEMVLAKCSSFYEGSGIVKDMDEDERARFERIIQEMAESSLRCIALAHRQVSEEAIKEREDGKKIVLTLLGLVGIKDPCRSGVKSAVQACQDAGVNIKMITGDNIFTAKAIAAECGILRPGDDAFKGAIVEGAEFREYTREERLQRVEKIRVMARSLPSDKLLMVQCLKQKGHVVAVTGDGTNDAPALKEADIRLLMGIQGTEVAKESSDIVIRDNNFASVATVLCWGRCVYSNIQKFIRFQLTVNVTALVMNFVVAVSFGDVPLTVVQLLWVNLITDTLGALALATEQPTRELMEKPPVSLTEPLISNIMWRNVVAQATYQMAILLTLQFKGESIFGVDEAVKRTLIFNTFVLCQVFNEFNARELEKKNVFKGIHKSKLFLGIIFMKVVLQVVMVEFLKRVANMERLSWGQWGACIGIAAASWPLGWVVKCIPVPKTPIFSWLGSKSKKLVTKIVHREQ